MNYANDQTCCCSESCEWWIFNYESGSEDL